MIKRTYNPSVVKRRKKFGFNKINKNFSKRFKKNEKFKNFELIKFE